jgi:hypothetical protein
MLTIFAAFVLVAALSLSGGFSQATDRVLRSIFGV